MSASLDAVLRGLAPESMTPLDAIAMLRAAIGVEKRATSLRLLLAARATAEEDWVGDGHRSAADWLSQETGSAYGEAAATLETSSKLADLPALEAAVRTGELSGVQAREIGRSATTESVDALIDKARSSSVEQLRKACRDEEARRRSDEDERTRAEKAHRERSLRESTGVDGVWRLEVNGTAMAGALAMGAIDAEADRVFKDAWKEGRREPRAAYRFDALIRLITSGGLRVGAPTKPKSQVVIRVDASRLSGGAGICTTTATGPVPVDEAIGAIVAGASVKVLLMKGVDVQQVADAGRHIRSELKTAVIERDAWACVRCGSRHNLELHHYKQDHAKGGLNSYRNLVPLCSHCHDLCSNEGHRIGGEAGAWEWLAPNHGARAGPN